MNKERIIKDMVWLRSKVDFDFIYDQDNFSHDDIKRYYKKTKWLLYRLFGHKDGYMHIAISDDGIHKSGINYYTYHTDKIDEVIKKYNCKKVLELGCGQGANLGYLAKRNSNVSFKGIDLYPSLDKKYRKYDISIMSGDYHNLEQIEDNSVDLVYAIETLCYSTNKNKIFKEVNRVLKKGGLFIIYDGYLAKERSSLSEIELIGAKLVENGYYLDEFEYIGNISKYIKDNAFKIIKEENMKDKVINHLISYQNRIKKYFKFKFIIKLFFKLIPKEVLGNIVPVYFMASTIDMNLSVYYCHILKNNKKIK